VTALAFWNLECTIRAGKTPEASEMQEMSHLESSDEL
jgi:hypothetical protein